MIKTKKCNKCEEELPVNSFFKRATNSDGLYSICKKCVKKEREKRRKNRKPLENPPQTKQCSQCKKILNLEEFYGCANSVIGVMSACKECSRKSIGSVGRKRKQPKNIPEGQRFCVECKQMKSIENFHIAVGERRVSICKDCCHILKGYKRHHRRRPKNEPKGKRLCLECQQFKTLKHFWEKDGKYYCPYCKECAANLRLVSKYKVEFSWYEKQFKEQCGKCAICKKPSKKNQVLCVDHDHVTRKTRKLLCQNCNFMLGDSKDSPEILRLGAKYLEKCKNETV